MRHLLNLRNQVQSNISAFYFNKMLKVYLQLCHVYIKKYSTITIVSYFTQLGFRL